VTVSLLPWAIEAVSRRLNGGPLPRFRLLDAEPVERRRKSIGWLEVAALHVGPSGPARACSGFDRKRMNADQRRDRLAIDDLRS